MQSDLSRRLTLVTSTFSDVALAASYIVMVAIWSLLIPFNHAPDELTHVFLVDYLVTFGKIPQPQVDPVTPYVGFLTGGLELNNKLSWYYGLPFAHSLGAAAFGKLFAHLLPNGYFAARLFNWILGGAFVFILIRLLLWSGLRRINAQLIAVLLATIPQVTFVFAYFNHDAFGIVAVTFALYTFLKMVKQPEQRTRDAYWFGAGSGLILLSKPYHYPALFFFALLLPLARWGDPTFRLSAIVAPAILTAILISGPILFWTFVEFGDVTGTKASEYFLSLQGFSSASRDICYVFCNDTLARWDAIWSFIKLSFASFFGVFGYMTLFFPNYIYLWWFLPLAIFFVFSSSLFVFGRLGAFVSHHDRGALFDAGFVALTILMLLGAAVMSLGASQILAPQPQGRYLFVVLPFVAYCLALLALQTEALVQRWRYPPARLLVTCVLASLSAGMIFVNLYGARYVLRPSGTVEGGLALNFEALTRSLSVSATGLYISVPSRADSVLGWVDRIWLDSVGMVTISGWAIDRKGGDPAIAAVIVYGGVVIHVAKVATPRPDVADVMGKPGALWSGFSMVFPMADLDPCLLQIFAITSALEAGELPLGDSARDCRK